jgi:hypothetical protein
MFMKLTPCKLRFAHIRYKLECLSLASQMFVGKVGAYPSEAPLRFSTLGKAPDITHKH